MFFEGVYTTIEKSKTKDEFVQSLNHSISENPIHCNFFEIGAKVLQSIKSPAVMGFSRVERNSKNVEVYASMSPGRPFPEYLSSLSSISDDRFTELVTQLVVCIGAVHNEGFFHQAINTNSFWVTEDGEIQLTLFETLEMRFCQQSPQEIHSNKRLQIIQKYLSPERKKDFKTLSFSDEYYSFGQLTWYIWCWKTGRITPNSDLDTLPPFEKTGTQWDRMWNSCLNSTATMRPNSITDLKSIVDEISNSFKAKKKKIELLEMKIPSPGESISEVEIATWLVSDGDYVEKDQSIAEVDSDKATLELPAEASGKIILKASEGDVVKVGQVVCLIDTSALKPAGKIKEKEKVSSPSEIPIVFHNFSANHYQIFCNKKPISNLKQDHEGTTLTVNVMSGSVFEIYRNLDNTLLDSFNTNDKKEYSLPIVSNKVINESINKPMEKKSSLSAGQVGLILGALIIIVGVIIYINLPPPPPPPGFEPVDGPTFAMIPPDGYTIIDTNNNNLLRKVGFDVEGTKWRFKEENWERFIPDGVNSLTGKWVKDNSQKVKLLSTYFEKIEVIESEGDLPPNYELIKGNDSILYHYGKKALDDNFYRYVNNRWYRKEGERWIKLVSIEDYRDVLESYFIDYDMLQTDVMYSGYIVGEGVRYRSEPSERYTSTKLGTFQNYKTYSDGTPYTKYENTTPDYVYVLFEKNGWYLARIESTGKIGWFKSDFFMISPGCSY